MKSNRINSIKSKIEQIERRYNAENDTIPDAPTVTWTDDAILTIIKELVNVIVTQQETIEKHEALIDRLFSNIEGMNRR